MDLPVVSGDLIAGKYRVEQKLGDGGMGVVVAAVHVKLNERRAIKMMRPEIVLNAESMRRFLREAQAAARLRSDHVAKVYDVDELEGGVPYMVMEYLEGADLAAVLASAGRLPVAEAVLYIRHACAALAEAHAAGLIHRDIKPSNLFLTHRADGAPSIKVLDFGVAKAVRGDVSAKKSAMTARGHMLGTVHYMSPEQMEGEVSIDARTDIWSLGVTLYQLVSGQLPFDAEGFMKLYGLIAEGDPRPLLPIAPDVPPELEALIFACLHKDRDKRPASALSLADALAPFSAADGPSAVAPRDLAALQARLLAPTEEAPAAGAKARTSLDMEVDTAAPRTAAPSAQTPHRPSGEASSSRLVLAAVVIALALGVTAVVISLRSSAVTSSPAQPTEAPRAVLSAVQAAVVREPSPTTAAPSASEPPPRVEPEPPPASPKATAKPRAPASASPAAPRASASVTPTAATLPPRPPGPSRTEVNIP